MEKFKLYKNIHNEDVAIFPLQIVPTANYLVVKVQWFNIACGTPFFMGLKEAIRIENDKIKDWVEYVA